MNGGVGGGVARGDGGACLSKLTDWSGLPGKYDCDSPSRARQ